MMLKPGLLINSLCNCLNTAIIITDLKGIIQYTNSVANALLGICNDDRISDHVDVNNSSYTKTVQVKNIRKNNTCEQFSIIQQRIDNRLLFVFEPVNQKQNSDNNMQYTCGTAPYSFKDIVGLDDIKQQAADIAEIDCNVLITGETGTGKELFASAIHNASPRASNRYVTVNCSAIPDALFESELFGYKKGAFTDARTDRMGLIEYATNGTLLLDEIGEMPLNLQTKLLRVVETQRIRPLGYSQEKRMDIRFIFSTNSDLAEKIKLKQFREDLYYRISMITIKIPPLRERVYEIPSLICKFLVNCQEKYERGTRSITDKALAHLMQYDYPGNVRELEGLIHRAYLTSKGNTIDFFINADADMNWMSLKQKVQEYRRSFVYRCYMAHGCDIRKTSEILGMSIKQIKRYLNQVQVAV